MKLRGATEADLDFIMRTERLPGYEIMVGHSARDVHAAEMARPESRYFIGEENGAPVVFAILQRLDDPNGNIYLKRIAVTQRGEGVGARMLVALQDWVFALPQAHRFYLHYSEQNERGHRAYARAGFRHEGIEREAYQLADGSRVSSFQVSILRPEWAALRGRAV